MKAVRMITATLLSVTFATSAMAASSATLLVQGSVGLTNDIIVTPTGTNNTTINIIAGETGKNIASAAESSNNATGYKILLSSANAGELRNTTDATKKTTYKVSYNGAASISPTTTPVQVKNVASLTALTTNNSAIAVDVIALPSAVAGNYQDTLTFTIQAN